MRIVEVISGLGLGGAERALARRLEFTPECFETHVVVTSSDSSHLLNVVSSRAEIHQQARSPVSAIRELQPDFVITHNPREAIRVLAHNRISLESRVVVVAHNEISSENTLKEFALDRILPRLNARAWRHLAVSSRAAAGVQCRGARDTRVTLLGGSFNDGCQLRRDLWPSETNYRVTVVGRFSPQKNLSGLLHAVQHARGALREAGVHLLVVGDGSERNALEASIETLAISDLVSIHGWADPPDGVIAAADTLLIPSLAEGGPLTLFEALLAGTRIMSTPVGASRDVLARDDESLILAGSDERGLSEGLFALAKQAPVTQLERNARRQRFKNLNVRNCSANFYEMLLAE